jgi:hypothetical protein
MMRKDISGGGFQKFRKKDEKRRFRRWISKIPKKKMRKDVSGGGFQQFRTNDEKRRFKRWRGQNLKNPKK